MCSYFEIWGKTWSWGDTTSRSDSKIVELLGLSLFYCQTNKIKDETYNPFTWIKKIKEQRSTLEDKVIVKLCFLICKHLYKQIKCKRNLMLIF